MADSTGRTGNGIYLIVGGLVVAVLVIGFFALGGRIGGSDRTVDIKIETPKVPARD